MKSIQDQVIEDIEQRKEIGLAEYGELLYEDNHVDMLRELYEELIDAACYTKAIMQRRGTLIKALDGYRNNPKLDTADSLELAVANFLWGEKNDS